MDSRTLELINLDLDGRLDEAAGDELAARLAADPAARAHHAQLRAVADQLAAAPAPELPDGFRDGVLQRAQWPQQRSQRWTPQRRRVVYALAASVVFAGVALQILNPSPTGTSELVAGTLARSQAVVSVARDAHGMTLDFQLPAGAAADVIVDFGGDAHGLTAAVPAGPAPRVQNGRIVVPGVTASRFTLRVDGAVASRGFEARMVRDGVTRPVSQTASGGSQQ